MTRLHVLLAGALSLTAANSCALQLRVSSPLSPTRDRIPARIDENQVVTLEGNIHPLARADYEIGPVADQTHLDHMMLLLAPSSAQQSALNILTAAQQDPQSPLFHKWLTPAQYAASFGVSDHDLARITQWLVGHGFKVDELSASHMLITFSGSAGQVSDTFHTEMRRYQLGTAQHIANSQNPQIPVALAGVVRGLVSLNDFHHAPQMHVARALGARPQWTIGGSHYLYPADFASIYDVNPIYSAGTNGVGASIAVAGRSNINISDVAAFRTASGLPANAPAVIVNGSDPGLVSNDQDESTLDVEWAGATAPAAHVTLVTSKSTGVSDGIDLSAQYIVNRALAPIVSVSYGTCEQAMGATELAFYNNLWQQAASEGISVFVSSGDAGAAGCNVGSDSTGSRAAVNGICSSPFSTCIGGTEFQEGNNAASYWAATNGGTDGSALGYIPETVWNESASNNGNQLWASGGGASTTYTQPAWQAGVNGTSAANGMRAVPDVSLNAAVHDGYVVYENGSYWIISGTSAAAPSFAGLMALVVERLGTGQGNINPALYGMLAASTKPFHATQSGSNSVPGVTGYTAIGAEYNLATGLGSVDAKQLVIGWGASAATKPPKIQWRGAPAMPSVPGAR